MGSTGPPAWARRTSRSSPRSRPVRRSWRRSSRARRRQWPARPARTSCEALGSLVSEVDARALTGAYGDYLADQIARALSNGIWGWFDDDVAFCTDWGFDLDGIEVPVSIWHGAQDRFVPIAHGEWLAEHVNGARVNFRPGDGHLSLVTDSYGEVLDDLLA